MNTDADTVRACLPQLGAHRADFREDWITVGMICHSAGLSCAEWDEWSRKSPKYQPGECERKWKGFSASGGAGVGTLVKMVRDDGGKVQTGGHHRAAGPGRALNWDDEVGGGPKEPAVPFIPRDPQGAKVPEPPATDTWATDSLVTYLEAMFQPEDIIAFTMDAYLDTDGKYKPQGKGTYSLTAGRIIASLKENAPHVSNALGDHVPDAGAWIRLNPFNGQGVDNKDIVNYRHVLVESDTTSLEQQLAIIQTLNLPCTAIVHSGKQSIHAIVKIDAGDNVDLYKRRVDYLYAVLLKNGFEVDTQCKNPNRLSRMPGIMRGSAKQYLVATKTGAASWAEWEAQINPPQNLLPKITSAADFMATPIPEPAHVIHGVLHLGSKAVYGGPSKAFKSWTLIDLCFAVANGGDWMGFRTTKLPTLYINFELQPFIVQKRLQAIAESRKEPIPELMMIWNLRGYARPLIDLLPDLLEHIKGRSYGLVVPDPIYKTMAGRNENDAGDIAAICNEIEAVALQTGAAIAFGAHFAKGNASAKEAMDRISGSGVWARDPDAIITASPHEEDDAFVVEMKLRNFQDPKPRAVRWKYPRMVIDPDMDTENLRQAKGEKGRPAKHHAKDILTHLTEPMSTTAWQKKCREESGVLSATFYTLLKEVQKAKLVLKSADARPVWSIAPPPPAQEPEDTSFDTATFE